MCSLTPDTQSSQHSLKVAAVHPRGAVTGSHRWRLMEFGIAQAVLGSASSVCVDTQARLRGPGRLCLLQGNVARHPVSEGNASHVHLSSKEFFPVGLPAAKFCGVCPPTVFLIHERRCFVLMAHRLHQDGWLCDHLSTWWHALPRLTIYCCDSPCRWASGSRGCSRSNTRLPAVGCCALPSTPPSAPSSTWCERGPASARG